MDDPRGRCVGDRYLSWHRSTVRARFLAFGDPRSDERLIAGEGFDESRKGDLFVVDQFGAAVRELVAKQEITEVLYRIARGTDRGDIELYASGFHDDGLDYHGLANGPVRHILANLAQSPLLLTQHSISNVLIDISGDRARVESYFTSFHQSRDSGDRLLDETVRGRYLDRFERREGVWKITRRVVVWDWSRVEPSGESWFDRMRRRPGVDDKFIFGRRDRQDMVYTDELPFDVDKNES